VDYWAGCGIATAVVIWSVIADRRRAGRTNPDKVGFMPWPLIMIFAMIAAASFASAALKLHQ
jgi:hypothetical protein